MSVNGKVDYDALSNTLKDTFWTNLNKELPDSEKWGTKADYDAMSAMNKLAFWEAFHQYRSDPDLGLFIQPVPVTSPLDPNVTLTDADAADDKDIDGDKVLNKDDKTPFGKRGPFGFFTSEQANNEPLPPIGNIKYDDPVEKCQANCDLKILNHKNICRNVMKRYEAWFKQNGCPVHIAPKIGGGSICLWNNEDLAIAEARKQDQACQNTGNTNTNNCGCNCNQNTNNCGCNTNNCWNQNTHNCWNQNTNNCGCNC